MGAKQVREQGKKKEACGEIYEEDNVRSSTLPVRMKQKAGVKIRLEQEEMRSRKKGNDKNDFAKVVFLALNTGESGRG